MLDRINSGLTELLHQAGSGRGLQPEAHKFGLGHMGCKMSETEVQLSGGQQCHVRLCPQVPSARPAACYTCPDGHCSGDCTAGQLQQASARHVGWECQPPDGGAGLTLAPAGALPKSIPNLVWGSPTHKLLLHIHPPPPPPAQVPQTGSGLAVAPRQQGTWSQAALACRHGRSAYSLLVQMQPWQLQ